MIKLIVLDVDGTLTDGKIYYSNSGDEIKAFNIKDGLMIASWNRLGKKSAIITGRVSKIVDKRAKELGITYIIQGSRNKAESLREIVKKENIDFSEVAIIGDDMNDYAMMKLVKKTFAPVDANLVSSGERGWPRCNNNDRLIINRWARCRQKAWRITRFLRFLCLDSTQPHTKPVRLWIKKLIRQDAQLENLTPAFDNFAGGILFDYRRCPP